MGIGRAAGTGSGLHAHRAPRALALPESEEKAPCEKPAQARPSRTSHAHGLQIEIPEPPATAACAENCSTGTTAVETTERVKPCATTIQSSCAALT